MSRPSKPPKPPRSTAFAAKAMSASAHRENHIVHEYVDRNESGEKLLFYESFAQALITESIEWTRAPRLDNQIIDLYNIYTQVQQMGGYQIVCAQWKWEDIAASAGQEQEGTHFWAVYAKYILPCERYITERLRAQEAAAREGAESRLIENARPIHHTQVVHNVSAVGGAEIVPKVVLALESGLIWETSWALNTLSVLTYHQQIVLKNCPSLLLAMLHHWEMALNIAAEFAPTPDVSEMGSSFRCISDDAEQAIHKVNCLLTIFLSLSTCPNNITLLCASKAFLVCTVRSLSPKGPLDLRAQETALAVLSNIAGAVRLGGCDKELCHMLIQAIFDWMELGHMAAESEETMDPSEMMRASDVGPGPKQWYLSYLILETLAKLTLPEENHEAFGNLSRSESTKLLDWLTSQVGLVATQCCELALLVLANVAAISALQRALVNHRELFRLLFYLSDPPAETLLRGQHEEYPTGLSRRRAAMVLAYLSEAPSTHAYFAVHQERILRAVMPNQSGHKPDPAVVDTFADILYNLSW